MDTFEQKYTQYQAMLHKLCFIHLRNQDDVQDVLQNVFIKLLYKAPVFDNDEYEKRWLIRVAINECHNYQNRFWRKTMSFDEEMYEKVPTNDLHFLLTLQTLPFKDRTVLHLFYYEEYTMKEIAKILVISESAVKMRLKRAKEKLKGELEETK